MKTINGINYLTDQEVREKLGKNAETPMAKSTLSRLRKQRDLNNQPLLPVSPIHKRCNLTSELDLEAYIQKKKTGG